METPNRHFVNLNRTLGLTRHKQPDIVSRIAKCIACLKRNAGGLQVSDSPDAYARAAGEVRSEVRVRKSAATIRSRTTNCWCVTQIASVQPWSNFTNSSCFNLARNPLRIGNIRKNNLGKHVNIFHIISPIRPFYVNFLHLRGQMCQLFTNKDYETTAIDQKSK